MTTIRLKQPVVCFAVLPAAFFVAGCTEPPVEIAISEPDPDLVFVRGYRGGQGMTDEEARLAPFADAGLTADAYLKLEG